MQCKNCGDRMEENGYCLVIRCPNTPEDTDIMEPDAQAVYCKGDQEADKSGRGREMKLYKPPKHLREEEIDRLPRLVSIDTRYVKPLENAVREDLREAEKRRRSGEQK